MLDEVFWFNFMFSRELKYLCKTLLNKLQAFWIKIELIAGMLDFASRLTQRNGRLLRSSVAFSSP